MMVGAARGVYGHIGYKKKRPEHRRSGRPCNLIVLDQRLSSVR
jgi:hypothetical protein